MPASLLSNRRLLQQRLSQHPLAKPAEVVTWLGAVQAQDYLGAQWALGLRMQPAAAEAVENALSAGEILRTHVMRPTWHLVSPADLRWLLELTAPRVRAASAYMNRRMELDEAVFARSRDILAKALQGGRALTRAELGAALAEAGIAADGIRLGLILMRLELDALLCSGPRRGKQVTYALLDERAPQARSLPHDEALAELTRRYFIGHGPATARDFAWWSGLTLADAKAGIAMAAAHLTQETFEGQTYWSPAEPLPDAASHPGAVLLPAYDEYLVGFNAFGRSRLAEGATDENLVFQATVLISGRIAGCWKRTFKKGGVLIEVAPFAPLSAAEGDAVQAAVQCYGEFVGMPAVWTVSNSDRRIK